MSSRKIVKSHSESLSNQVKLNGIGHKRNLMKQEEIDLTQENNLDKGKTVKSSHSISICINTFDEIQSEENMRQDLLNDGDQGSEINNLGNGINKITIDDEEFNQLSDVSILPNSDNLDLKDKKRTKHLVRCEAVRESSLSPPPFNSEANQVNSKTQSFNTNHLTVYSNNKNVTIIKNSLKSSNSQSNSATTSPSLSRDSSTENTNSNLEYSSAELQVFLADTLKRSQKDRIFLYKVEDEILQLINNSSKELHKFTPTSSYNRLLIHRMAAYFGLEHNVDHTHTSVIVTKTKTTQIPEKKLKELINSEDSSDEPKKCILKRDSTSLEDSSSSSFEKDKSPEAHLNGSLSDSSRSRSLEEREENYERVRARIFSNATKGHSTEEPKSPNPEEDLDAKVNIDEAKPSDDAIDLKKVSSLENESHNECDKPIKEALLPTINKTTVTNNSTNNQVKSINNEAKKGSPHSNRNENNNRNNKFHRKGASMDQNYNNRFQQNRKGDPMVSRVNEHDWSLKPNLNAKMTSQNMPYNMFYPPGSVDGHFAPRFSAMNPLNPHAQNGGNQFPLGHPYMQSPLLLNEQLFPQMNYMNAAMLPLISNQANVPNTLLNAINYNSNGVNSTFSSNLSMPNNYPFLYGNIPQAMCGPNGLPYSPPPNMNGPVPNFNSLIGMTYPQYPPPQAVQIGNLMSNMHPNFKPPQTMNEFDKGQMKNPHFAKPPMQQPLLNYFPPGQFPYSPEVLDRNMTSVQFNASTDLPISNRGGAMPNAPFNYPNVNNKRLLNEPLLMNPNNPNLPPQPSPMYLNQPKPFFGNQSKPNSLNKYPNNNNGNNRNRRGPNLLNANRKY